MKVAEAARLSIATERSRVDPSAPFRAFSNPGSLIQIDHPLLHEAPLSRIVIAIDWTNLPRDGLARYYRGYDLDPPIREASFIVTVTAPLAGWTGGERRLSLFGAGGVSRFDLMAMGTRVPGKMPVTLTLAAPAYGFADTAYPKAVAAAALRGARGGRARIPNPPWAPMATHVTLSVE